MRWCFENSLPVLDLRKLLIKFLDSDFKEIHIKSYQVYQEGGFRWCFLMLWQKTLWKLRGIQVSLIVRLHSEIWKTVLRTHVWFHKKILRETTWTEGRISSCWNKIKQQFLQNLHHHFPQLRRGSSWVLWSEHKAAHSLSKNVALAVLQESSQG